MECVPDVSGYKSCSDPDDVFCFAAESEMRDWLIAHGYMKTETQKKRDEVVDLFRKNYDWSASKSLAYLTWR